MFRVDIHHPIVYVYEEGVSENYISRERAGTAGLEIKARHSSRALLLTLCYGNYQVVRSATALPEVELPAPYDHAYQSVPRHKVTLVAGWKVVGEQRSKLPTRAKGPVRAQLKPGKELGWSGGKAGT